MQQKIYKHYIGIDVSKYKLDIATSTGKEFTLENNATGIKSLMVNCQEELTEGLTVMEASGGYEQFCLKRLSQAGFSVSLANAKRVRDYAKSQGILAKTDKIDARLIKRFAMHSELRVYQSKHEGEEIKVELLGRRDQLVKLIMMEKQRLEKAGANTQASIRRIREVLEGELATIEKALKECIAADKAAQEMVERLMTVPGIGETLAIQLMIDLPELGKISDKSITALSGLAPFNQESGKYKGKRKISGGRYSVRKSLFLCVLTAIRHNKRIKDFYQKLIGKGKCKMVAIVACMRKMVIILNTMARKKVTWVN